MFFKRKVEDKIEETATVTVQKPVPQAPELTEEKLLTEMTDLEREEYTRVATKLGLENSPTLLWERLKAFMKENCITVYSNDSVVRYLNFKYGGTHGRWQWRPLRAGDEKRTAIRDWSKRDSDFPENGTLVFWTPNFKKIPLGVLLEVEKVATEFPTVGFLVSDHPTDAEKREADPFLAVTVPGVDWIMVIAKWDEPGFKP